MCGHHKHPPPSPFACSFCDSTQARCALPCGSTFRKTSFKNQFCQLDATNVSTPPPSPPLFRCPAHCLSLFFRVPPVLCASGIEGLEGRAPPVVSGQVTRRVVPYKRVQPTAAAIPQLSAFSSSPSSPQCSHLSKPPPPFTPSRARASHAPSSSRMPCLTAIPQVWRTFGLRLLPQRTITRLNAIR